MPGIQSFLMWLRALVRRDRIESEMEKEMRLHLELETEENVRRGMSPTEARRRALISFGGVEKNKESVRDERRTRWLEDLASDVRYALRGFRRQPGFTAAVVLLVGLGVGVNATIFSVVNHLLIEPLPFADGNRMVQFVNIAGGGNVRVTPMRGDADRWMARAHAVEQIMVYEGVSYVVGDTTLATPPVSGAMLSPGGLAFVGAKPVVGRDLVWQDTIADAPRVALIGQSLWSSRYGASANVIGQTIDLDGVRHTIIGVLPGKFQLPFDGVVDVVTNFKSTTTFGRIDLMAKLRPGVSVDAANRELAGIFTDPAASPGRGSDGPKVFRQIDYVSSTTRRAVLVMFAAVCVLLLVACANVANLLMTRAWGRQRELAVRVAMGAGRGRLVRQMFTESFVLAVAGAVFAIAVGFATRRLLVAVGTTYDMSYLREAPIRPAVIGWAFVLIVLTGVLFGLAPALFVMGQRAAESLKAGARSSAGSRGARRFRGALVVVEVALSAMLLVASGLLVRSIIAIQHADTGVDVEGLWGVSVGLRNSQIGDSLARQAVYEDMLRRVRAVPGVRAVTFAMDLPPLFGGLSMSPLEIEGLERGVADSIKAMSFTQARPDIFAIAGIKLIEGHSFSLVSAPIDYSHGTELVVNERFAKTFWPTGSALGHRVRRGTQPWATIVGVAANVDVPSGRRGAAVDRLQYYEASGGAPSSGMLVIRSTTPMSVLLPAVTAAVREASPLVKITKSQSAGFVLVAAQTVHRVMLTLVGAFAGLALLLAAFGLHAVIAYGVTQRTREIGIRVALGAETRDVTRLIVGQGVRLAAIGVVLGAVGGMLGARTLRAILYGVTPADPATLLGAGGLLFLVAVLSSLLPARRALLIDPTEALRAE